MYSPPYNRVEDRAEVIAFMRAHNFPVLVTGLGGALQGSHLPAMDPQWLPKFDALEPKYVRGMLNGIVNFQIPVTRIEARWKLSQNRGRREMELIIAALGEQGETALAALMRKHLVE